MNKYFVNYENDVDNYGNPGASMTVEIPISDLSEEIQDELSAYDNALGHNAVMYYDKELENFDFDAMIHDGNVILYAFVLDGGYLIDESDIIDEFDIKEYYYEHIDEGVKYDDLKQDIIKQASSIGVKLSQLEFFNG